MSLQPRSSVPIAPGSAEQTQARGAGSIGSTTGYRPVEVPARVRTGHACDRCRELRAKCSGGVRCAKCTKDDANCSYSDRKRERNKKTLARSAQQIDDLQNDKRLLIATLRSLLDGPGVDGEKHTDILGMIETMTETPPDSSRLSSHGAGHEQSRDAIPGQVPEPSPMASDTAGGLSNAGESHVRSDIGSPDRRRELVAAVDLDFGVGMPGYVGKMSDVSWMQRVRSYLNDSQSAGESDTGIANLDISALEGPTMSYFTEDVNLLAVDEDYVDPHVVPNWQVARVLTEAYFHSIQGCFRFLERSQFYRDLRRVYDNVAEHKAPDWPQRRTLAVANMIWTVGARWIELTKLNERNYMDNSSEPMIEDQLIYYARARALGLDHRMQLDHPSLETVQGLAVLGFYLLSNGSIQRAWSIVAQTIRHATALGLHLKVSSGVFSNEEFKKRASIWWSLFRLEVLLSEITGRPKCVNEQVITVPRTSVLSEEDRVDDETPSVIDPPDSAFNSAELWQSFMGDNSLIGETLKGGVIPWSKLVPMGFNMSENHFPAALELSGISNKIGSILYLSPADLTWADVQTTVRDLEADLACWQELLSSDLKIDRIGESDVDPRSNLDIEMNLCSLRMILYRPFLCEIHIEDESARSIDFNQRSARAGVIAAIRMTQILPDDPVAAQVLMILPWWTLLHYISQATAILCLELCLNVQHMQEETRDVMMALRKALNYLWALSPTSKSAYRAWNTYRPLVEKVAQKYRRSILTEMPSEAARPAGWSEEDERNLRATVAQLPH